MSSSTVNSFALNAARRSTELAALAGGEVVDLLVVGGGVTGAGVALDAASRGLSVCLAEAHDLAFGTSRWSSKLVHGGLRYLASGDVGLARESAVERDVLMRVVAPHLIRPLAQVIPLHDNVSRRQATLATLGVGAGDALRRVAGTPSSVLAAPRRIGRAETLRRVPGLRADGLRGGLLAYDGQLVDDARFVLALARTAAGHGARVLTRVRVTALDGAGADVRDERTGDSFRIRARATVNATGVWAGELVEQIRLRPSRGSHLVLDAAGVGVRDTAVTIPYPGSHSRFALLLPQQGNRVYLGLTDELVTGPVPDVPEVPQSDVDTLLSLASSALREPLEHSRVLGAFAGLRPLVDMPGSAASAGADLSRRHLVHRSPDGVISVVGGKLTTYRRMAADAVDAAIRSAGLPLLASRTHRLPLAGAGPVQSDVDSSLVARYGTDAERIDALGRVDPELAEPLAGTGGLTAAEVIWAVRQEGALSVDDVLDRRTRIGLVPADRAAALAPVARIVRRALDGLRAAP